MSKLQVHVKGLPTNTALLWVHVHMSFLRHTELQTVSESPSTVSVLIESLPELGVLISTKGLFPMEALSISVALKRLIRNGLREILAKAEDISFLIISV